MSKNVMIVLLVVIGLGFTGYAAGEEAPSPPASLLRPPQFTQPAAGNTVDASFRVALEGIPKDAACVSVMQEQATILIDRSILDYLVIARPPASQTLDSHMADVNRRRAALLLGKVMDVKDGAGCSIVEMPFDEDALYLISELLKAGQAAVVDNNTGMPVDHIYVRYKAFRARPLAGKGDILFSFSEKSASFLTILWWIS